LTSPKSHEGPATALYPLTSAKNLVKQADAFLLCCRIDRNLAPTTISNYQYHLKQFIGFCSGIGVTTSGKISIQHIRQFLLKLREHNNPISVSDYLKTIKRFFNWMVEEDIIAESPATKMRLGRLPKILIKPFTYSDINALLLLCSGNRFLDLRNRAMTLILIDTGIRLGEMAGIQLSDIDFESETIRVMGKGAKERIVRIGKATQKALLRYLLARNDDFPCLWVTEERRPLTREGIRIQVKVLCKRAGIVGKKLGPHTFRHTMATMSLRNGASPFDIQSILGHETLHMTKKYTETVNSEDAVKAHRKFSPVDNMGL